MSALFRPLRLRSLEIPNRCWVSPMCQYSAVEGIVGAWHRMHLGVFATGGAGRPHSHMPPMAQAFL